MVLPIKCHHLPPVTCHQTSDSRYLLPATCHLPLSSYFMPVYTWCLDLIKSLYRGCRSQHGSIQSSMIGSIIQSCMIGSILPFESVVVSMEPSMLGVCHRGQSAVYMSVCLGVFLWVPRILTWEHTVKLAWSAPPSENKSIHESMLRSVHENILGRVVGCLLAVSLDSLVGYLGSVLECILRAYLEAHSQAGWKCVIGCNWESMWECAWEFTWEHFDSLLGSVSQEGREYRMNWNQEYTIECTWEYAMECIQQLNFIQHDEVY